MAQQFGYIGKILRANLTSGKLTATPTSDYAEKYIGGRGMATRIYWEEVPPDISALDPRNKLIVATGPLGGLAGTSGSIWQLYGKSPATVPEQFCYCNMAGHWGAHLKFAGYDGIVVEGAADKLVYLLIDDGKAEIRDASHLRGKRNGEARQILKQELGDSARILSAGPAGENLVAFANAYADNDASGSSGMGALMGSKKLKAVVVRGSGKVAVARPDEFEEMVKYARELNRDKKMVPVTVYAKLPGVNEKKYACYGCICGCGRTLAETSDGVRTKRFCQSGCFYQDAVLKHYGAYNDVVIKAYRICNDYGIDTRLAESITKWLVSCNNAGILDDKNTGIPISKVGSLEYIETLVRKIALREGFGDLLSRGPLEAAHSLGGKAEEMLTAYASTGEGRAPAFDPRMYPMHAPIHALEAKQPMWQLNEVGTIMAHWSGWALKQSVPLDSFKVGQQHPMAHRLYIDNVEELRSAIDYCYVSSDAIRKSAKIFWGSEEAADFSTFEGKALAGKKIQDRSFAKECLVLCSILWPNMHRKHTEDHVGDPNAQARMLSAVTGRKISNEELEKVGERVFNLTRANVMREGRRGRLDDKLPEVCFTTPLAMEAYNPNCLAPGKDGKIFSKKGSILDRKDFEKLMDEYYELRGWDVASGLQTKAKLQELGLGDVATALAKTGKVK